MFDYEVKWLIVLVVIREIKERTKRKRKKSIRIREVESIEVIKKTWVRIRNNYKLIFIL